MVVLLILCFLAVGLKQCPLVVVLIQIDGLIQYALVVDTMWWGCYNVVVLIQCCRADTIWWGRYNVVGLIQCGAADTMWWG